VLFLFRTLVIRKGWRSEADKIERYMRGCRGTNIKKYKMKLRTELDYL